MTGMLAGPPHRNLAARAALAALLIAIALPAGAGVKVEITGLTDDEAGSARASLELAQYATRDDVTPAQLRRLVMRGEGEIRRAMEPYGYYETQVSGETSGTAPDFRAVFRVVRGQRTLVRKADVRMEGPAAELPVIRAAIDAFEPRPGEGLDHHSYEISKSGVGTLLSAWGYFDAELLRHRVEVTRATRSADIDLAWRSGERYRIGPVRFDEAQLPEDFLRRHVPWADGSEYSVNQLLALQQRLVDADYFSTVSVQPDLEGRADGVVPVDVLLVPAKRSIYTANAFVSTDLGPGGRLGFERRWLNDGGHKFGIGLEHSGRLKSGTTFYRIPRPGRRNRSYNLSAGYRDEETAADTRSRLSRVTANETLDNWGGYTRVIGLQYVNGDFTVADEQRSSSLLFAEATLARKRADDLLFPTQGVSIAYTTRFALQGVLTDTSLAQLRADVKWVLPGTDVSRFILRASAGVLQTGNFDALPPELRFFAGGDRSVRGFDYQAIGERNDRNGVVGGRYLAVASAEYEHYFWKEWGLATFVDSGDAFNRRPEFNVGAGVGLRWRSPIGILRLDFALPLRTDLEDGGLRFHIVIGPDL
jgi:translocation and assembly module TamA